MVWLEGNFPSIAPWGNINYELVQATRLYMRTSFALVVGMKTLPLASAERTSGITSLRLREPRLLLLMLLRLVILEVFEGSQKRLYVDCINMRFANWVKRCLHRIYKCRHPQSRSEDGVPFHAPSFRKKWRCDVEGGLTGFPSVEMELKRAGVEETCACKLSTSRMDARGHFSTATRLVCGQWDRVCWRKELRREKN